MFIKSQISSVEEAKAYIKSGTKALITIASLLTFFIIFSFIKQSYFNLSYLTPIILAILLVFVRFRVSKVAAITLLAFPVLILVNILKDFDLNGGFWLAATPFILQMIFVSYFFYGSARIVEGIFAYHRLKEHDKLNQIPISIVD